MKKKPKMKMPENHPNFTILVMGYTVAIQKAITGKGGTEQITPEESLKIAEFIQKAIEESFKPEVAPHIIMQFLAELNAFKAWMDTLKDAAFNKAK